MVEEKESNPTEAEVGESSRAELVSYLILRGTIYMRIVLAMLFQGLLPMPEDEDKEILHFCFYATKRFPDGKHNQRCNQTLLNEVVLRLRRMLCLLLKSM